MILPQIHCLVMLIITIVTHTSASKVQTKHEDDFSRSKRHLFLHHQSFPHSNPIFQWVFGQNEQRNLPLSFAQKFFLGSAENDEHTHTKNSLRLRPTLNFPISEEDLQKTKLVANVYGKKYSTAHQNVVPTHGEIVFHHHSTVGEKFNQSHKSSKHSKSHSYKFRLLPSYHVPIRFFSKFDSKKPSLVQAKDVVIKTVYGTPVVDANSQNKTQYIIGRNATKDSEQHGRTLKSTNGKIQASGQSQQIVDEFYNFHLIPKFTNTKVFNSLYWQKLQHIFSTNKKFKAQKSKPLATTTYFFNTLPSFKDSKVFQNLNDSETLEIIKVENTIHEPIVQNQHSISVKNKNSNIDYYQASQNFDNKAYAQVSKKFKNGEVFQNSKPSVTFSHQILPGLENSTFTKHTNELDAKNSKSKTSKLESNKVLENFQVTSKILPDFEKHSIFEYNNGQSQKTKDSVDVEEPPFGTVISESNSSQNKDEEVLVPASSSEQNFKTGSSALKTEAGSSKNSEVPIHNIVKDTKQNFVATKFNTFKENKLPSVDGKAIFSKKATENDKFHRNKITTTEEKDIKNSNVTKSVPKFNEYDEYDKFDEYDEYEVSGKNFTSKTPAFHVIKKYEEGDFSDILTNNNPETSEKVKEQSKKETSKSLVNETVINSRNSEKKVKVKVFKRPVYYL